MNNNTVFSNKEAVQAFRRQWATLARNPDTRKLLTATAHALRASLLGKPLERQFSPVTNPVKLANGMSPWLSLEKSLQGLRVYRYPRHREAPCVSTETGKLLEILAGTVSIQHLEAIESREIRMEPPLRGLK